MIQKIKIYLQGFAHLLYPHLCLACSTEALGYDQIICDQCEAALPYTNFSKMQSSPVDKIFWGRAPIQTANSILFFTKESLVQKIVLELKYKQNKKAGSLLGKLMAQDFLATHDSLTIDFLVPIPISKQKLRKRGFNQCQIICASMIENGLNSSIFDGLQKIKNSATQTHKDRLQRGLQTNNLFKIKDAISIKDKNILLVDDVLTTGATMEAAIHCLQSANPAKIYVITAAYTID